MGCSREKAELVIQDCYELSLTAALKKHGVKPQNFFSTLANVPSLDEKYVRAQHGRSELYMDEIINIADTEDNAQKARNQIDARKLYASKMKPNKFGDRIDVNLNQTVDIRGALDEARTRIRDVLDISKTQLIETKQDSSTQDVGSQPAIDVGTAKNELDDLLE